MSSQVLSQNEQTSGEEGIFLSGQDMNLEHGSFASKLLVSCAI